MTPTWWNLRMVSSRLDLPVRAGSPRLLRVPVRPILRGAGPGGEPVVPNRRERFRAGYVRCCKDRGGSISDTWRWVELSCRFLPGRRFRLGLDSADGGR